jgi:hypothetical protein
MNPNSTNPVATSNVPQESGPNMAETSPKFSAAEEPIIPSMTLLTMESTKDSITITVTLTVSATVTANSLPDVADPSTAMEINNRV